MAFTEKEAKEAISFINEMADSIPDDIMFLAFCYTCLDVREFQFARCLTCKDAWRPLLEHFEKGKPMTI